MRIKQTKQTKQRRSQTTATENRDEDAQAPIDNVVDVTTQGLPVCRVQPQYKWN